MNILAYRIQKASDAPVHVQEFLRLMEGKNEGGQAQQVEPLLLENLQVEINMHNYFQSCTSMIAPAWDIAWGFIKQQVLAASCCQNMGGDLGEKVGGRRLSDSLRASSGVAELLN